jgi:pimeloyl-ACP methyl ester carboxylesterase
LISGQKDNLCPNVMQKKIAQTNSLVTWIEIPRCGHFIPLEQPKKLTHLIQNWINLPPTKTET